MNINNLSDNGILKFVLQFLSGIILLRRQLDLISHEDGRDVENLTVLISSSSNGPWTVRRTSRFPPVCTNASIVLDKKLESKSSKKPRVNTEIFYLKKIFSAVDEQVPSSRRVAK